MIVYSAVSKLSYSIYTDLIADVLDLRPPAQRKVQTDSKPRNNSRCLTYMRASFGTMKTPIALSLSAPGFNLSGYSFNMAENTSASVVGFLSRTLPKSSIYLLVESKCHVPSISSACLWPGTTYVGFNARTFSMPRIHSSLFALVFASMSIW